MRKTASLLATLLTGALAACGGSSPSANSSPGAPATVNVGESIVTVSNAAIYAAMDMGYFKDNNITFNLTTLQSGATATQAIASGSIDYALAGSFDIVTAAGQGIPLQAVVANVGITMEVCGSKKFAADHNLTASSSINQIMSAFKGTTMGITGPHAAPDLVLRYLLPKYGNLKPDTDVKIVALGSVPAELTALQANQDVTRRVAQAIAKGDNFARDPKNTDQMLTILKKYFPTIADATLRELLTGLIQPIIPKDGKMTSQEWDTISSMLEVQGAISKKLDTKEGNLWTNSYLK